MIASGNQREPSLLEDLADIDTSFTRIAARRGLTLPALRDALFDSAPASDEDDASMNEGVSGGMGGDGSRGGGGSGGCSGGGGAAEQRQALADLSLAREQLILARARIVAIETLVNACAAPNLETARKAAGAILRITPRRAIDRSRPTPRES